MKGELIKCDLDPRSPSTAFYRTPILLNTSKNNLLLNSSDDNVDSYSSPAAPKTKVLGFDPRSPTNEFVRTPIVVPDDPNTPLIKKIHNKNLEKVIQSEICTTPTLKKDKINPKLLESSPVKRRNDSYKRKSFVGLLETNIDFTETDIDAVLKEKCRIRESIDTEELEFETNLQEKDEILHRNNEPDDIELETNCFEENVASNADQDKILPNENLEDKLEEVDNFDLNAIVDLIVKESKEQDCANTKDIILHEENVEKIDNLTDKQENETFQKEAPKIKSAPLTPTTNVQPKPKSESKSAPDTPPFVNITADMKELDKKLTNLIYEDQDIVVCPRIVQLKDVLERSPLKNRNRSQSENKKSGQKLKVSDKPRKSDFAVSKIPVFNKTSKNTVQCENTPPRNMERKGRNGKKSQWDSNDVTLYL